MNKNQLNHKLNWPTRFWDKRIRQPILSQLTDGISCGRISYSITMGYFAAVYPQIAMTTVMAYLLTKLFRLNPLIVQSVNWILSPLQFVLMIPHLRIGEKLLGIEPFRMPLSEITEIVFRDPIGSFSILGRPLVHAILGWIVLGIITLPCVYYINWFILIRFKRKLELSGQITSPEMKGEAE